MAIQSTTATISNPALPIGGELVPRIWQRAFHSLPSDVFKVGATNNDVFKVSYKDEVFFLKLAATGQQHLLALELEVIEYLRRQRLPVPEIVDSLIEPVERSWLVLRSAGTPVASIIHKRPELLPEAGELLAGYHAADQFGLQRAIAASVERRHCFSKRLHRLATRALQIAATGQLDTAIINKVIPALEDYRPQSSPVLCHGEYSLAHVLADSQGVTAAIDWPYCELLPAAADIALFEIFCRMRSLSFHEFMAGYGRSTSSYYADPDRLTMLLAHTVRQLVPGRRNFSLCRELLNEFAERL